MALSAFSLLAQAAASTAVSDSLLYQSLFQRVAGQKKFGDYLDTRGKDSSYIRSELRLRSGLTVSEYAVLAAVATDYLTSHRAWLALRSQLAGVARDARTAGGPIDSGTSLQLAALTTQNATISQTHIAQLQTQLGAQRFKLLDTFARTAILPGISHKLIKPGVSTPKVKIP